MRDEMPDAIGLPVREAPAIPVERLRACLRDEYGMGGAALEFLPRGRDYDAGGYHVVAERGEAYFLKVTTRPLYAPSCLTPHYLVEQGIAAVVAPLPTTRGTLWATLDDGWRAQLYPYLDGDTSWAGMTSAHWREVGRIFQRIHALRPSSEQLERLGSPRRETFDPAGYGDWVRSFEAEQLRSRVEGSAAGLAVRAAWVAHQPAIHAAVVALETLGAALVARPLAAVICHADLHAANVLRDAAGGVHVIDWDEVMLAPPERDFIFVREAPSDAFWEGYGAHAIDWVALAYFQFERAVQDIIEDARQACSRDDLGEGVKADVARAFEASFAPGGNLDAAYAVAAHLPPEMGISPHWAE